MFYLFKDFNFFIKGDRHLHISWSMGDERHQINEIYVYSHCGYVVLYFRSCCCGCNGKS